jgi:DNA-binding Xre family transcriptional regulator
MLNLDLIRVMENKGIENFSQFLIKSGFTRHTTHRLLYNKVETLSYRHLEKLCVLFNCTIDDLFTWKPDPDTPEPEKLQLNKLTNRKSNAPIRAKLKNLSLDQLEQVGDFLQQIESKQKSIII